MNRSKPSQRHGAATWVASVGCCKDALFAERNVSVGARRFCKACCCRYLDFFLRSQGHYRKRASSGSLAGHERGECADFRSILKRERECVGEWSHCSKVGPLLMTTICLSREIGTRLVELGGTCKYYSVNVRDADAVRVRIVVHFRNRRWRTVGDRPSCVAPYFRVTDHMRLELARPRKVRCSFRRLVW